MSGATARIAAWLARALAATLKLRMQGEEHWRAAQATRRPVLMVFWHEDLFGIVALHLLTNWRRGPDKPVTTMVSRSRDGEKLAQVMARVGISAVRGSSSRGGMRGLIELERWMRTTQGPFGGLALDGPRGPRRVAKPGAVLLGRHAGALVLPVAMHFSRAWIFNSWDRTKLAKPWATLECRFAPLMDAAQWPAEGREERNAMLSKCLEQLRLGAG